MDNVKNVLLLVFPVVAGCAVLRPWEAIVVGMVGGLCAVVGVPFFDWLKVDDPVGAISVHGLAGIWVKDSQKSSMGRCDGCI